MLSIADFVGSLRDHNARPWTGSYSSASGRNVGWGLAVVLSRCLGTHGLQWNR
jgi:hypothetical protein